MQTVLLCYNTCMLSMLWLYLDFASSNQMWIYSVHPTLKGALDAEYDGHYDRSVIIYCLGIHSSSDKAYLGD